MKLPICTPAAGPRHRRPRPVQVCCDRSRRPVSRCSCRMRTVAVVFHGNVGRRQLLGGLSCAAHDRTGRLVHGCKPQDTVHEWTCTGRALCMGCQPLKCVPLKVVVQCRPSGWQSGKFSRPRQHKEQGRNSTYVARFGVKSNRSASVLLSCLQRRVHASSRDVAEGNARRQRHTPRVRHYGASP